MPTYVQSVSAGPAGPVAIDAGVDKKTQQGKGVYPESRFLIRAAIAIIAGAIAGTLIFDHLGTSISFTPPQGIGFFALFYLIAQVVERLQEPFAPFLGTAPNEEKGRDNQLTAKAKLEAAAASARLRTVTAETVADRKRTVDQVRANLKVLMFGTGAALGMLLAGYLKARFLTAVGVSGTVTWFDILVTGLAVGGGTKVLHDLISNIQESKEKKQDPAGTK